MMRQNVFVILGTILMTANGAVPADSKIRAILARRIDDLHQSVGIVVGAIGPEGRTIVSYGGLNQGDPRPLNADTVFEIGSVSKVFTSLLLADMVHRGEVALADPVSKYLPAGVKMPQRNGRQITLQDLATHTSGLPRLPSNLRPKSISNPYADYSVAQLYEFLSSYELTRDIGSKYEYSNLGGGLLGHVLALRAGMSYEQLLRTRITAPLGMKDTAIALSPEMTARLAVGHDAQMNTAANWDMPALAGAGAIRSTANDLLTFLAAALGFTETSLAAPFESMLSVRQPTGVPNLDIALGWHVIVRSQGPLIWHNGGTGGYRSYVGYDPKTRTGVVALSNASTQAGVDDIGQHILDPSAPLIGSVVQPKERTAIMVDPKLFEQYAGRYELAPNFILTVTREGDCLFVQATGQSKFELFPESAKEFFLKAVDAQVTFESASRIVLHQGGRDMPAKRIE